MSESRAGNDGPNLSDLYFFFTNSVSQIVFLLAVDFVTRPVRYAVITEKTAGLLNDFRLGMGRDPQMPNASERASLYASYFGRSHFYGSLSDGSLFHRLTSELRRNAASVAENGGTDNDLLVTAFRASASRVAQYIQKYTEGGANSAFLNTYQRLANVIEKACEILKQPDVAIAFGVKAPDPVRNLLDNQNRSLYLLLEQITKQVPSLRPIPADRFAAAAVAASAGKLTLSALSSHSFTKFSLTTLRSGKDALDDALSPAYSWQSSLRNLDSLLGAKS
jgi:hypothetical protein